MEEQTIKNFRISIRTADIISLLFFLVNVILYLLNVLAFDHIIGTIMGFLCLKLVYELQLNKMKKNKFGGSSLIINMIIYFIFMFIAIKISFESFIMLGFIIIVYRFILFTTLKKMVN